MTEVEIEVFADVWCPFTHVGLRRLVEHRAERTDVLLRVRSWPLELINGRPLDPEFVAEEIDGIRSGVAPDLFAGFDRDRFPTTTLDALRLTAQAYRSSGRVGEAVALELRDRLFERGEDISDPAVLDAVAEAHELGERHDPDGVVDSDWARGREAGVVGSPHFFTPADDFFCPALDVRRVDGHLRIAADPEGIERFLESCFPTDA